MRLPLLLLAFASAAYARPGLLFQPYHTIGGIEYAQTNTPLVHGHPAVELNAASEEQLPSEFLKSKKFYNNPLIAEGLAKESWFTNKEMQVVEREAEKIPRSRIYSIVKNAGFLDRN